MRDFEDPDLWRISDFERLRTERGTSGYVSLDGPTVLPTTLLADLERLGGSPLEGDALEVVAACMRHREPALLYLQHDGLVWPVTVFPREVLYHSPRDLTQAARGGIPTLRLLSAEPPGVRPPGHYMHERVMPAEQYRPLVPLLWTLALKGPRKTLLTEISGTAAYRLASGSSAQQMAASGALGSAMERLRRESVSLREMAAWPGLSVERASRLLNALYLTSSLMMVRTHPAARSGLNLRERFLQWRRARR
jgi:hypothetical protein